ncbi:hypothetical protein LEP1GSC179_1736 [Leptospira santarosai str. MOR084]|uniref:Uncharacterized protein n=1 Tax=Leptospira santarosai str. MOR084 TaxID=1049984 RepID=A0A0E2BGX7_9LEPT|nr:hypothetical protein LEP1GSC179_1736 [Leptospira santarosai str. MOR084]
MSSCSTDRNDCEKALYDLIPKFNSKFLNSSFVFKFSDYNGRTFAWIRLSGLRWKIESFLHKILKQRSLYDIRK